jgi:hypothetical protein
MAIRALRTFLSVCLAVPRSASRGPVLRRPPIPEGLLGAKRGKSHTVGQALELDAHAHVRPDLAGLTADDASDQAQSRLLGEIDDSHDVGNLLGESGKRRLVNHDPRVHPAESTDPLPVQGSARALRTTVRGLMEVSATVEALQHPKLPSSAAVPEALSQYVRFGRGAHP